MTHSLDTLRIDTPENVTFSHEVAGIGSRFLGVAIDTLLIGILQLIVIGTVLLIMSQLDALNTGGSVLAWTIGILAFIGFLFFWGYYIFFETSWNGQTPGKRLIGLRVIRMDGTPVGFSEVLVRNLVRTVDVLPAAYAVGVITMFISENSRRLGDLAAGTVVVHEGRVSLGEGPQGSRAASITRQEDNSLPEGFPLTQLTDQDWQVIESFLLRRAHLANRSQLALYILRSLCARLEYSMNPSFEQDPEHLLIVIHKARQNLGAH